MSDVKIAFLVQRLPYKSENPKLAATHAMSYQTVEILLEDGQTITPALCYVGEGVLNCLKDQKAMETYGITSTEMHLKNCLLVDMDVYACKEDLDKYGIGEDKVIDAEDMGADKKLQIVPFAKIQELMETSNHVMFF
ncbi:MAG: DsrE family protein [Nitrospirae bacterium]|nr:DsrE family protein [Nitrospirota bacterium]MCL5978746.1 DsrE family protein [Nitrospirota bacterium]